MSPIPLFPVFGRRTTRCLSLLAALTFPAAHGYSSEAATDKSAYTLFNPVPDGQLRELAPDRPDKTESPYTVDAGHFQLETDFVTFTRNHSQGERTQTWNAAPFNLKAGLLHNVDLQFVFDSYLHERTRSGAPTHTTTRSGVGDLTTRLKINFWGNDGGSTAFGAMPWVKFPTHSAGLGNNGVEGGVIFPLAVQLPGEWGLGMMTEIDSVRNDGSSGYHAEFVNSVTVSHKIAGRLGGYLEFYSAVSTERGHDWVGTVDAGLTCLVTENLQLDCGVNIGVTRAADDLNPFAGLTWRF